MSTQERAAGRAILIAGLIVVAATIAFIAYQQISLTGILSAPDWCARAINAERVAEGRQQTSCGDLLLRQVKAIALNSHIYAATMSLGLLVLIVIVLAGGKLGLSVSKSGASASISREAEAVADQVAGAAVDEAEAVKREVRP